MNWYRTIRAAALSALLLVLAACSGAAPSTGEATSSAAPSVAASVAPSVAASAAPSVAPASSAAASDDAADSSASAAASEAAASEAASSAAASAAADGGTTPGDLPLYTGATTLDPNSPIAAALNGVKQQLEQQQGDVNVAVDLYQLPAGTTFEQVRQFYDDALTADGWTDATDQAQLPEIPGGGTAAWSRNVSEAAAVLVIADPTTSGNAFLVVSHATPK